ncbi:MAG: glycosyltransferase [Alphaproteobacteria bacterium]
MKTELVIVSYNRSEILADTLESIRRLYPDLRICLGLQGADAEALARRFEHAFGLRTVCLESPSVTESLNRAILSSSAEVVLMLDDDAVPCPGWLDAHIAAFEADTALAYTSGREIRVHKGRSVPSELLRMAVETLLRLVVPRGAVLQGRIVGWLTPFGVLLGNLDRPGSCVINAPRGCNMALRTSVFRDMGGFSTAFRGNAWGFEPEFGARLARQGRLGRYVGEAVVLHSEAASGGTRQQKGRAWFEDFLHNHKVLMATVGRQAWLGALPRLAMRWLGTRRSASRTG